MEELETHKGRNLLSAGISIGVHVALLILLSFLTMKAVSPSLKDDGIPVLLAEVPEEEPEEMEEEVEEPEQPEEQRLINPDVNGPDEGPGTPTLAGNQEDASGADMKTPPKTEVSGPVPREAASPVKKTSGTEAKKEVASKSQAATTAPKQAEKTEAKPAVKKAEENLTNKSKQKTSITQNSEPSVTKNDNAAAKKAAEEAAIEGVEVLNAARKRLAEAEAEEDGEEYINKED